MRVHGAPLIEAWENKTGLRREAFSLEKMDYPAGNPDLKSPEKGRVVFSGDFIGKKRGIQQHFYS